MWRLSRHCRGSEGSQSHCAVRYRAQGGRAMNAFEYQRAPDAAAAVQAISPGAKFLAGGTNLIDLMKNQVERPGKLIDLNRVALAQIEPLADGGLRLGALARNSDTANHPLVRERYPLL